MRPVSTSRNNAKSQQAVPGILESSGSILLEDEMTDPCEPVTRDRRGEQKPWIARDERASQDDHDRSGTDNMQAPARRIAVLRQIERIEVSEAPKSLMRTH